MSNEPIADTTVVETLLRHLEESKQHLLDAVSQVTAQEFAWEAPGGDSIRRTLEKAADDLTFFYGWLVTRARGLRPIPCLHSAEFSSVLEASIGLQVAHRRLVGMLHDLHPDELDHLVGEEGKELLSLGRVLELAAQHWRDTAARSGALRQAFRERQP